MRNLKVTAAYRGTEYHGFQRQSNAVTVQETLEKHLSKVLNEPVTVIGCSRTDTGVHANNFCFNVKTNSSIRCQGFIRGVNGELPEDISILDLRTRRLISTRATTARARSTFTRYIAANRKILSPPTLCSITADRSTSAQCARRQSTLWASMISLHFVPTAQMFHQLCAMFTHLK